MTTRPFPSGCEGVFMRAPLVAKQPVSRDVESMLHMRTTPLHATVNPDSSARCLLHFLVGVRVFT
jgi:hypothetical protein